MILLIDNYDSFTYNLYQAIGQLYPNVTVVRNDQITISQIQSMQPQAIVISPGPGYPKNAGISIDAIQAFCEHVPILGVCLGHQSIAQAFGGTIVPAKHLMHGKASIITADTTCPLFTQLPQQITVARYHSLIVQEETLPDCLQITARDENGQIMALQHRNHPTFGVQFHPESILTKDGMQILKNFLQNIAGIPSRPLHTEYLLPPEERNALKPYLFQMIEGKHLSEQQAYDAMSYIMNGEATDAQIGSFTTALRMKGETVDELTGFARVMRQKAATIPNGKHAVDIVGTGGDLANTFNISTTAAFVAAGAGATVAKHGNRSVSSRSGSADVLEALGVSINMTPRQAADCLAQCGICFLFAPAFHGSMKFAAASRRQIGVRTVFNLLGPLANPAMNEFIVLGVYDGALLNTMAQVLQRLGIQHAMLIHGSDGLDEVTIAGSTAVCELREQQLRSYEINPQDFGLPCSTLQEVVGGNAQENAVITLEILNGKQGAQRNIVVLNAACALYTAGIAQTLEAGIAMAQKSIDSGRALQKLEALRQATHKGEHI